MVKVHQDTLVLHSTLSEKCSPNKYGAINTEIQLSTTFKQSYPGVPMSNFEYSRSGNPTNNALQYSLQVLENSKYAFTFSSGLAALDAVISILDHGNRIACVADIYGGSRRYLTNIASKSDIRIDYYNNMLEVNYFLYNLVIIETPTNPTLRVYDLEEITNNARFYNPNIKIMVDNTFMSPINQNPLKFGVDIVLHSLTKYINGHSDVLGGAVMCNDNEIANKIYKHQYSLGAVLSPFDCYMIQRGIKTLALRMEKHNSNALFIAQELEKEEKIKTVIYPGLESHPQHEIAIKQCNGGYGGIITIVYDGDVDEFVNKLKLFTLAESLGAVESLVNVPSKMTHASVPIKIREMLGITDQMIRLSIGCENKEDLLNDIICAL